MGLPVHFDWVYYVFANEDLRHNGVQTEMEAKMHFLHYGRQEGRPYELVMIQKAPDLVPSFYSLLPGNASMEKEGRVFRDRIRSMPIDKYHGIRIGAMDTEGGRLTALWTIILLNENIVDYEWIAMGIQEEHHHRLECLHGPSLRIIPEATPEQFSSDYFSLLLIPSLFDPDLYHRWKSTVKGEDGFCWCAQ